MKTATAQIDNLRDMLCHLPKNKLQEVYDFVSYLIEKDRKHRAFIKRVLEIEKNPDTIRCSSVDEVMEAIRNADVDEAD
ncbi:MAG: hypothetical protein HY754_03335 [Nitrospirae bacterium]|nr:hypothetical protein [Nitrospirota bacterium]